MGLDFERIEDEILNKQFTAAFRKGYISVKGTTLPEIYKDLHGAIENLEVYDDDVWVCSFPKTGTTWTQEMVWLIANDLDFEGAKRNIGGRFPFLDYNFIFDYGPIYEKYEDFDPGVYHEDAIKYINEYKGRRFIKTHLPWNLLPKQIQNGTRSPKIIYVTRNPKDTCVSYYHHCRFSEGYKGEFNEFCRLFLEGKVSFGPFWTNVSQYWKNRNQPNILFLKYEDLKIDLPACMKRIAEFLGKTLNEEQIKLLMNHLSFDNMRNNKSVNYSEINALHKKYGINEHDGNFMRAGNVHGYKSVMTQELIIKFDNWIETSPYGKELGY